MPKFLLNRASGFDPDLKNASYFPKNQGQMYVGCVNQGKKGKFLDIRLWWRSLDRAQDPENSDIYRASMKGITVNTKDAALWMIEFLKNHLDQIDLSSPDQVPALRVENGRESP